MTTLTPEQLALVTGGDGPACTFDNPTGAPSPTYLSAGAPPQRESPNLGYVDELEHALHGRPPIPR